MTKRLQVLLDDDELLDVQRAARAERLTVAEWVRGALRTARARTVSPEQKLAALRLATRHEFPTADIEELLAQIEAGYAGTSGRARRPVQRPRR